MAFSVESQSSISTTLNKICGLIFDLSNADFMITGDKMKITLVKQ